MQSRSRCCPSPTFMHRPMRGPGIPGSSQAKPQHTPRPCRHPLTHRFTIAEVVQWKNTLLRRLGSRPPRAPKRAPCAHGCKALTVFRTPPPKTRLCYPTLCPAAVRIHRYDNLGIGWRWEGNRRSSLLLMRDLAASMGRDTHDTAMHGMGRRVWAALARRGSR